MECRRITGRKVYPIFYHVEPSEILEQKGDYGIMPLTLCEENAGEERKQKIRCWKAALREARELKGKHVKDHGQKLKSLPPNFPGDSLSLLNSSYSDIRPLWEGNKNLGNLIVLNLSSFRNLVKIPNISSVPTLERLNFPGCAMLSIYPVITEKMETLEDPHMGLLEIVCLYDCSKPQTLSEITVKLKNLTQLHLVETAIKELPSSIENLTAHEVLDLKLCESLANLPSSICELKHLKSLRLSGCSNLQNFPEITRQMEYFEWLYLDGTAIKELPLSIKNLTALEVLDLELCESLANLPSSISDLERLKSLQLSGCSNLQSFPEIRCSYLWNFPETYRAFRKLARR